MKQCASSGNSQPSLRRQQAQVASVMGLRVRRTFKADQVRSVLVRGPNWLGDAVLAIPVLSNLRRVFYDAKISLLVYPWLSDLFRASPFIDEVLEVPGRNQVARLVTELRRRSFELALILPNSFRAALISALAGIPHRIGYMTDWRWPLLTIGVCPPSRPSLHQADSYLELLRALKWDSWERPSGLVLPPGCAGEAERLLRASNVTADAPLLGIAPGAAYGTAKRWLLHRFSEAADLLADRFGCTSLLFGSPMEASLTESVRKHMRGTAVDFGGKTSLIALASLLSRCRLLLTNDTGAMHLAAALRVPCVAIFGPTDPRISGPLGPGHRILHDPPACSPCRYRDCPIDHRCMVAIGVKQVVAAAEALLDASGFCDRSGEVRLPAVFLDRDGTINEEVGPVQHPELMRPIRGAAAGLKRLGEGGFLRVVVSNQSRVARGDATEELVQATHQRLLQLLCQDGGWAEAFYFCPHHPDEGHFPYRRACQCRKPNPGLIHQAVFEQGVDLGRSYLIGDQQTDIMLAERLGVPSVLVLTGFGHETLRRLDTEGGPRPAYVATDLSAAAEWILQRSGVK